MPRDRANIRANVWADTNWRALSKGAQHLYLLLLSHPGLNYAGVCDWRPGRIARMTAGETVKSVTASADELQRAAFVLRDDETEEICVRSFVKHDGLMKHPQLSVSMANAYGELASPAIRRVIAFEVQKLYAREPQLIAWQKPQVRHILSEPSFDLTAAQADPAPGLAVDPAPELAPKSVPGQGVATTTSTTTSTEEPLSPAFADDGMVLIPDGWAPSARHRDKAKSLGLDVDQESARFVENAHRKFRRLKNWNTGFTNWLRKQAEYQQEQQASGRTASVAPFKRQTAVERNLADYNQMWEGQPDGSQRDAHALGQGIGH